MIETKVHQPTYSVSVCIFQYVHHFSFVADAFTYGNKTYLEDVFCFYGRLLGKSFGKVHQLITIDQYESKESL